MSTAHVTQVAGKCLEIVTPWNQQYVDHFRFVIPHGHREWDFVKKCWSVDLEFAGRALDLLHVYFDSVQIHHAPSEYERMLLANIKLPHRRDVGAAPLQEEMLSSGFTPAAIAIAHRAIVALAERKLDPTSLSPGALMLIPQVGTVTVGAIYQYCEIGHPCITAPAVSPVMVTDNRAPVEMFRNTAEADAFHRDVDRFMSGDEPA